MVKYATTALVLLALTISSVAADGVSANGEGYSEGDQWHKTGMLFKDEGNNKVFRLRALGSVPSCAESNAENNPNGNPCMQWGISEADGNGQEDTFFWPVKEGGLEKDNSGGRRLQESCSILNLVLGVLDLSVLGLNVHLNQVVLAVTATPGSGLLGNLLCSLTGATLGLGALLNQVLGALGLGSIVGGLLGTLG